MYGTEEQRMNLNGTLTALAAELRKLYGNRYRGLYLYGSYARGEADESSDVDLLLVLAGEIRPTAEIRYSSAVVSTLALDSGYLLAVLPVAEEEYRTGEKPFLANVWQDAVSVTAAVAG